MVETKVLGAEHIAKMIELPERFLATVLLCNEFVQTAAATLGTIIAVSIWNDNIAALASTIGVTILLLIFADVAPKSFAVRHAERLAVLYVYPLEVITKLVSPIASLLTRLGIFVSGGGSISQSLVSEEEIRSMISAGQDEGVMEATEAEMLHRVFDFGDRKVREVMTPRPEIVGLDIEGGIKLADFLATYSGNPHSRFPVFREDINNILGVISIKDVLMAQAQESLGPDSSLSELVRPVHFVPEHTRIAQLLVEMRAGGYNLAVVVDEYGSTSGIVTIENLMEEIVGRLREEVIGAEKEFEYIDERTIQVDGSMNVEEANDELGLGIPTGEGEYETVAGFILNLLGHIPRKGEQVRYNSMKLVIAEMSGLKIEKVLVTKE
jgi:putative hemolysin